jgi:hypothetical protein
VASAFVWVIVLMGLAILGVCFFYPREIGKEDQKLVDVKLDIERLEDIALRVRLAAERRLAERRARSAERSQRAARRRAEMDARAAQAQGGPPPTPIRPAPPPPAMGAPQPVLTEDAAAALSLAGGNGGSTFDGADGAFL